MYTRNAFNHLFMLVLSFVSLGFGVIVLLLLAGWIGPAQVSPNGTIFFNQWNYFAQMRTGHPLFDILVGGISAFAGLVVFIWELLPLRASRREEAVHA
jgi:hypothetical protein